MDNYVRPEHVSLALIAIGKEVDAGRYVHMARHFIINVPAIGTLDKDRSNF